MSGKLAISGATGLVGTALTAHLVEQGYVVFALIRTPGSQPDSSIPLQWDPYGKSIDSEKLEGLDAVINLSGAGIADSRWTNDRMKVLRDSRIITTTFLSDALASLESRPGAFLSASATGFYGDRSPDEELDESSSPGAGFLAELCKEWEASTKSAEDAGIRTVHMRTGIVLDSVGGALAKMLPYFRKGFGAKIGSGNQMMSWISKSDIIRAIEFIAFGSELSGPVNLVSPNPVSNTRFTKVLADALRKPVFAPVPAFVAKLKFGRMAEETILAGQNVIPAKLIEAGFEFDQGELDHALSEILAGSGN